ncbi:LINE-1 retrotransposable element ORF2 protein [Cucumis melo var. makuwa]|uniref:LINE-1 retrotransposable element ORF2 protein n=1 Tax=Cucumis melo var. makuwa TaxID=1194695 RepID=A0A5A7UAZ0_CUCMM|nr:LINE-1 retrotransposable element ORF2 protein [Cucumis melo var. makuwa]
MPSYYRPISLTTSLYKIMAKALANRLKVTLADTVAENQKALIKGRQITDAILIANEAIDTWKQKKTKVVRFRPIVAQSSAAVEPLRSSSDFVTQATPIVTPLRRISFNASHFAVAQSTAASSVVVHRRSPQPESHAHPTRIAAPTPFSTKSDLTHVSSLQPDSGLQSLRTANQPDSRPSP